MLSALAEVLIELDRLDKAEPAARRGLELARVIGDRQSSVFGLVLLAYVAARRGDHARAHLLWGAVEAEADRAPIGHWETEREDYRIKVLLAEGEELERPFTRRRYRGGPGRRALRRLLAARPPALTRSSAPRAARTSSGIGSEFAFVVPRLSIARR